MVATSVLLDGPKFLLFECPDGETGMAVYRLGRWRGIDRWRGFELKRRRSRRPFLESGKVRVPVQVMAEALD